MLKRVRVAQRSIGAAAVVVFAARPVVAQVGPGSPVPVDSARRVMPPADALRTGLMPLRSAGVDRFAAAHPTFDGRGVLIAILDSGIDPGVPGLQTTSDGAAKILDLRDFSGEGRIRLEPVVRRGDTLIVHGRRLLGASHVASAAADPAVWGGMVDEAALGKAPAADLNGNSVVGDSLPVVVAKTPSGWALFADTQGDGTLADDRPIHDYAIAHESFGWAASGRAPALDLAANITESGATPRLDLFFDTSSHGTHVSGIAAGHDLYGVPGFDGVAPGARLIGLKISNDAHGAVTVTGSMVRALDYAIRFAAERRMPLVVNLSFGVGNEVDGTARIDALVDSILLAHPDVVMTVAAGNDGPGLSTIGFPGSASRVISVGATLPAAFVGDASADTPEPVAPFSSRGAEIAAPDILVPGAAYSTIPRYAAGDEVENGTSMASPYAAGLAARLESGLHAGGRSAPSAREIRQALRMGAHVLPSGTVADEGAGLPDLVAAWTWLGVAHDLPDLAVDVGSVKGRGGVVLTAEPGTARQLGARVAIRRLDSSAPMTVRLHASAPWLQVPEEVALDAGRGEFTVSATAAASAAPGAMVGSITIEGSDETAGALATIPVIVRTPMSAAAMRTAVTPIPAGGVARAFVLADSGRGMQIEVATSSPSEHVSAALHEPGGMPFRDGASVAAGAGTAAGLFDIGAGDVVAGLYEIDAVAAPTAAASARITVREAPLRLGAAVVHDTLLVTARSLSVAPLSVRLRAGLIGAERRIVVQRSGDSAVRITVPVPKWAAHLVVDTHMPAQEWSRFTDFGLSFLDRRGHELDVAPINYAMSRATIELPDSVVGDSLVILLSPGFAEAVPSNTWSIELDVRYYVDTPYSLDAGGSAYKPVAAGALRDERFTPDTIPIALPDDFLPLVTLVALEGTENIWTRELSLPRWTGHPR